MPVDIVIPNVGESVTSGVIAAWLKKDGDWIERDETVLSLETDKVTMDVPAPSSGVVKTSAKEGDTVDVGAVVGTIDESASKPAGASQAKAESKASAAPAKAEAPKQEAPRTEPAREPVAAGAAHENGARATPLAEKMAREFGVDISRIKGTGAGHRVREQDVLAFVQNGSGSHAAPVAPAASSRSSSVERMTPLRQRIAQRLVEAQHTAAMLTTFNEVDMGPVMELRKKYKESFEKKHGIGLGFMSFFVSAAASALRAFPMVNAYIVEGEDGKPAVEKHDYCDVAIAVSSPKGLVVPVLRSAESRSFAEIENAVKDFAVRAKDGKLALEEMQGGTFTITNGGIFGSLMSTPILNPPQSAILGMHSIKNRAVEHPQKPGEVAIRPMMYLALSYDHRIVDGAEAVRFLVHIKDAIEDPTRLLIGL
ncbi:MAG: 2-oxoglutarate dehydrogenase complex dihydrolipoyllysine-residue succinyltransferase [Phycisphaerales bacterium]|jgi:2-oxoglutarate dehydrogenase E2 component (dihydrolipoamide succinyltransferase)|nr:2-oxoglutarate dehydrogenase complex dihydrolipoyllysine-residue succinyltransferase [Phycisphaerales bacterium]